MVHIDTPNRSPCFGKFKFCRNINLWELFICFFKFVETKTRITEHKIEKTNNPIWRTGNRSRKINIEDANISIDTKKLNCHFIHVIYLYGNWHKLYPMSLTIFSFTPLFSFSLELISIKTRPNLAVKNPT